MTDTKAKHKKLTLIVLTAVIIFSYGYAYHKYMNPPRMILSGVEQGTVKELIDSACPELIPLYDANLNEDATLLMDTAQELLKRCQSVVLNGYKKQSFHEAFVEEMEKANAR